MESMIEGVSASDIVAQPFPHVVLDRPMSASLYRRFTADVPDFQRVGWAGEPPDNERYQYSAWQILRDERLDHSWHDFARTYTSRAFFDQVVALFADIWPRVNPAFAALLRDKPDLTTGLLGVDGFEAADVLLDARLEINTPVRKGPTSVRWAHVDTPDRIYSGLFYLRSPEDDSIGGDLGLFRWTSGQPGDVERFELPADRVEQVVTVPYGANRLVLFPNSPHAIHGVTPRAVTPHERAYMFLTAEVEQDLFGPLARRTQAPGPGPR